MKMIYLDNASTTQVDNRVIDAMMPFLTESYGNAGTLYELGRKSADAIMEARKYVADLIHAEPSQIIFTSGGSEANNMVFAGLRDYLLANNKTHIVTTKIEHDSILHMVEKMCNTQYVDGKTNIKDGFDATYISPVFNSCICPEDVENAITSSTGIVSIMHTNNETGIVNNVAAIGKICKKHNVLFHTDCVQAAGCSELDVDEIGCDFLSISSHKIHGVKGVGALFVKDKSILSPLIYGGHSQEYGLRGGTENVAGIVAFGEACRILKEDFSRDVEYITALRKMLYDGIKEDLSSKGLNDIFHVNGNINLDEHGKTFNARFDGVDAETLLMLLDARGVCVSAGSACTSHEAKPSHVLLALGIDEEDIRNSIRFSVSRMNTNIEIIQASKIIADCVSILRGKH